jgi:hypothetical protein
METRKPVDVADGEVSEPSCDKHGACGAVSLGAAREIECELLLEELAEVIESERGILTP